MRVTITMKPEYAGQANPLSAAAASETKSTNAASASNPAQAMIPTPTAETQKQSILTNIGNLRKLIKMSAEIKPNHYPAWKALAFAEDIKNALGALDVRQKSDIAHPFNDLIQDIERNGLFKDDQLKELKETKDAIRKSAEDDLTKKREGYMKNLLGGFFE